MTSIATASVDIRLVSVVVPVFNESKTVSTVIDRIRATGLPIELIVVDDGSTDGTRAVLRVSGRESIG
jgi:glycosyltransferase involved in cell wall biosynthesis